MRVCRTGATLAAVLVASAGCMVGPRHPDVDPSISFVAHETHQGLMIDRIASGSPELVTPRGGFHLEPVFDVRTATGESEELHVEGPGRVVIQERTTDGTARSVGQVDPTWEHNAIRLTISRQGTGPIETDVFRRVDGNAGPGEFTRVERDSVDLRGTYRAALRTADGRSVGWLAFAVGENQPGHVAYLGVLPPTMDEGLAAATAEALGSEIAYVESTTSGVTRHPYQR